MERYKKLTILHSNDLHGDFLEEKIDDKLVGGVSLLSGYIQSVRNNEPNVLYCIAGDMFRGSVIDSEYLGVSTIEIVNLLAPDVVTIGNHETDYGLAHLLFIEKCASFPIINANLHIKSNGKRLFNPYEIVKVDGMKILFIGITTDEVIANTKKEGIISTFINVEDAAKEVGKICDAFNSVDIDFTILLTHIGFDEDKKLAAALDPSWGVDVIIGGHSHTFMDQPEKVNDVLIVQAGIGTDQIGRFDIIVDTDNNCVDSYTWKAIAINDKNCTRDKKMEQRIMEIKAQTDLKYDRVVCRFDKKLTHPVRNMQTELGSLMADVLKDALGLDVFLINSASIRKTSMGPIVTLGELCETVPFKERALQLLVTGKELRHMMNFVYRDEAWDADCHTQFYQISEGFEIQYSKSKHEIVSFKYHGKEVEDTQQFRLGLCEFHYLSMGEFFDVDTKVIEERQQARTVTTDYSATVQEYLSSGKRLATPKMDRFTFVD